MFTSVIVVIDDAHTSDNGSESMIDRNLEAMHSHYRLAGFEIVVGKGVGLTLPTVVWKATFDGKTLAIAQYQRQILQTQFMRREVLQGVNRSFKVAFAGCLHR